MPIKPYKVICPKCHIEHYSASRSDVVCAKCKRKTKPYPKIYYKNRKIALERDEHRCQCCGTEGDINNNLIIHHLDCRRENNSLSNMITICQSCHAELHRLYTEPFLRRSNIYKIFAQAENFGEYGKPIFYDPAKKIVKKQFGGKPKLFFGVKSLKKNEKNN